jgi:hypothetical protein
MHSNHILFFFKSLDFECINELKCLYETCLNERFILASYMPTFNPLLYKNMVLFKNTYIAKAKTPTTFDILKSDFQHIS